MQLKKFKKLIASIDKSFDNLEVVVFVEEASDMEPVVSTALRCNDQQVQLLTVYDMKPIGR